ncbi:MAG: dihydrolipoyl dehydrogenase, partial [Gammaproteobacteria bacterium]|nr:dihydrolipoyl dehydrogenase [Gammaproteobacteria bacterium]
MEYDVIVVGAGPAGYHAAIRASQLGLKTACIDAWTDDAGKPLPGGTCLNVGCIPSKTLLDISHKYASAQEEYASLGITVGKVEIDIEKMQQRKADVVSQLTQGVSGLLKANKVEFVSGRATVTSPTEVSVCLPGGESMQLKAEALILAPGSSPIRIPPCPIDDELIVDSTGALSFDQVPKRLGIIGAGVIGLELGSVWQRLGAEVVILEALPDFLPAVDAQVAKETLKLFKKQGLDIRLGARVTGAEVKGKKTKQVSVSYEQDSDASVEVFDRLVVAVGRAPATDGLLADGCGVARTERGEIIVDENCHTGIGSVFAVGDAVRGPMLAHKGMEEGVMVAELIAGKKPQVNYDLVPGVIYTHPEVAWVGANEQDLIEAGTDYGVGVFPLAASGRAIASSEKDGMVKVLTEQSTDRVVGVHVVGAHASELIAQAVIAMEFGASAEDIGLTMFAHPT